MSFRSVRRLTQELSRLKTFENPKIQSEQYATPPFIAADWVWQMALKGELAGKTILDAGCGPGILGIAALLLGAKHVYFIDNDPEAMKICQENYNKTLQNYEIGEATFICENIVLFDQEVDLVVQNPPFGTKEKHADKPFLETAFRVSNLVYSMHKTVTDAFIEAVAKDFSFSVVEEWKYKMPLKSQFSHHKKDVKYIEVSVFRIEKVI